MTFETYLMNWKERIDARLKTLLVTEEPHFARLYEAMNYSLLAGGKRLRPILLLAAAEALGKDAAPYLDLACALECIHTYSLIHDDLPCMDDDDLRRGKSTNHVVYGAGLATLAGDGLLTFAFELLARQQQIAPEKLNRCIALIARAAGPAGMVGGQAFDLASDGEMAIGREGMELLHRSKTGVIFKAAIEMAAVLADAAPEQRQALDDYALYMGLTFQITDDILDVVGDEKVLGKPVGSDLRNDKATYVTIFSLDEARRMAAEAAEKAVSALQPLGDSAWFLKALVEHLLTRTK
ncbi:MAG: polyprenyl synthetase family protein [Megasphaera sp.]|uniref:polyprenyl synthetase family protein n=1 Tax=Megasphaera sp. TaxID=2023260 RepID=UPI003F0FCA1F